MRFYFFKILTRIRKICLPYNLILYTSLNLCYFQMTGTEIICQSRGSPFPNISWTKADGTPIATIPGLRQVSRLLTVQYTTKLYRKFSKICFEMNK
jgi:hypothetical protein